MSRQGHHGMGVTEANAACFVYTATGETDFGDNGGSGDANYALNLFVR